MKAKIKIVFLFIMATICVSSINKSSCKAGMSSQDSLNSKIVYISPNKCLYVIEFDSKGFGKMTYGKTNNYEDSIPVFTSIIKEKKFSLKAKKTSNLNTIINDVKNSSKLKGEHHWDAWHRILFINNKIKVDVYGLDSKKMEEIIDILSPCLPFKIDYTNC